MKLSLNSIGLQLQRISLTTCMMYIVQNALKSSLHIFIKNALQYTIHIIVFYEQKKKCRDLSTHTMYNNQTKNEMTKKEILISQNINIIVIYLTFNTIKT